MQSSWVTSSPVTSPGRGRVTWPQRAGGRGAKWLRGSYIGGLHAPGYRAGAGPGYMGPGYRAGGAAGQPEPGSGPEGSSQPGPGRGIGQPGRGCWGWLGAGLHIPACNGAVTGYSMQGRGYIPKDPRQPQGASGGLFSWGLFLEGYISNRPSGNWNVLEQPSTNCKPSSGLSQRPLRFISLSGGITISASIGCNCVRSTE